MHSLVIIALVATVAAGYRPARPNNGCGGGGGCGGQALLPQSSSCGPNGCGGGGGGGSAKGDYWWQDNGAFQGTASHVSSGGSGSRPQQGYVQPRPVSSPGRPSPAQNLVQQPMGICPADFVCVHWQLCRDGFVIADGTGNINKGIKNIPSQVSSNSLSCGGDMICCGVPSGSRPGFQQPQILAPAPTPPRPAPAPARPQTTQQFRPAPAPQQQYRPAPAPAPIQPRPQPAPAPAPRPQATQQYKPSPAPAPQRPSTGFSQPARPAPAPQRPSAGFSQPARPAPAPSTNYVRPQSQQQIAAPSRPAPAPQRPSTGFSQPARPAPAPQRPSTGFSQPARPAPAPSTNYVRPQSQQQPQRPAINQPIQPRPQQSVQQPISNPIGLVSPPNPQPMMGMMMGMMMPMRGGSCSAGTYCVPRNMCNPYNGFIIRDPTLLMAVVQDAPTVPLIPCFVQDGSVTDGVCCQESHPNAAGAD